MDHWKQQGHRALVFTQTQQMLDILEKAVQDAGLTYHRMDGSTPVNQRARLVDDFNTNEEVFVFLLTTKVGGLGINLTGANRCTHNMRLLLPYLPAQQRSHTNYI